MDSVDKKTKADVLRAGEPPDPGADGRFWSSDGSHDEMIDRDSASHNNNKEGYTGTKSRKGKAKPSSFLDGSTEAALHRYGIHPSEGIHKNHQRNRPLKKSVSTRTTQRAQGKENELYDINSEDRNLHETESCMGVTIDASADEGSMHGVLGTPQNLNTTDHSPKGNLSGTEGMNATVSTLVNIMSNGGVLTNMEDEGDSILNNLSNYDSACNIKDDMEGEDLETSIIEARDRWKDQDDEPRDAILQRILLLDKTPFEDTGISFFGTTNSMVECLAKWWERHSPSHHAVRRKYKSTNGNQSVWIDIEHSGDSNETGIQGGVKKKFRGAPLCPSRGAHTKAPHTYGSKHNIEDVNGRTIHKIWNSKNRKPEKNIPTSKLCFKQDFIGDDIRKQAVGIRDFHMGTTRKEKTRDSIMGHKRLSRPRCSLYDLIAEKQARLVDIATRINTTSENGLLLSSIRGLSYRPLKQFSAKVDGNGRARKSERGGGMEMPNVSSRNVVNTPTLNTTSSTSHEKSRTDDTEKPQSKLGNESMEELQQKNMETHARGHAGNLEKQASKISIMETQNRFALLDDAGNELMDTQREFEEEDTIENMQTKMNMGWIKKQERTLNSSYFNDVSQDQRYEAKRYILDRLIPLASIFTSWPKRLTSYFCQLCSLYGFDEGYRAARRFKVHGMETRAEDEFGSRDSSMEEVDSETDGSAQIMKTDGPDVLSHEIHRHNPPPHECY
ncbi:hypothetical protein L1987_56715 [Smallanthus sonchifolius]|uniref:Uncharacterized protein n=1 Tax=Smallanthus sonchifolius TaxID=185202 RepID=A0ACB9EDU1_9ASTR|nr:hypothetical protein L1987_56715 [Smallanthus sonchifolius]